MMIEVEVAQEDIDLGVKMAPTGCMAHLAIMETIKEDMVEFVSVTSTDVWFRLKDGSDFVSAFPREESLRILRFDCGIKVLPHSFPIDIPDCLLREPVVHEIAAQEPVAMPIMGLPSLLADLPMEVEYA